MLIYSQAGVLKSGEEMLKTTLRKLFVTFVSLTLASFMLRVVL